jgi:hypothetical protein
MTPRLSNRLFWTASAAMLGLSVGAIALAISMPIENATSADGSPGTSVTALRKGQIISREQLDRDAARELRQPLIDVSAPATDALAAAAPPPLPPLVGTIVEPGRSIALVQMLGTTVSFKSVGDTVADARIVAIDGAGMTVVRQGQTVSVRISPPEPAKPILARKQENAP